jgi:hypothetical protein
MWYLMDDIANQREREIAARTRAPLFVQHSGAGPSWRVRLPALSLGKWRHWSAAPDRVHCSRAASIAGAC